MPRFSTIAGEHQGNTHAESPAPMTAVGRVVGLNLD
jgi:hypothetical protein